MQSSNTLLQYRYPNELLRVKKNKNKKQKKTNKKKKKKKRDESVLCTFLSLFGLTTLLFSLTTVHGVVTGQLAPLRFDPCKVWLLFDNTRIECTKV